jgi:hypothetical protein
MWLMVFLAWGTLNGCTWTSRSEKHDIRWPLVSTSGKTRIGLVVSKEEYLNGQRRPEVETLLTLSAAQTEAFHAYTTSGLFEQVQIGLHDEPVTAEVHISIHSQEDNIWTSICVWTFWVVPCQSTQHVVVGTTVRNDKYEVVGMVENSGDQEVWRGWIFFAALPIRLFYHPPDLMFDLIRLGIHEAHAKKWLYMSKEIEKEKG